jgi:hypothetical protein
MPDAPGEEFAVSRGKMDTFGVTLTKLKRLCHRPNPSASYYFGLRRVLAPIGARRGI